MDQNRQIAKTKTTAVEAGRARGRTTRARKSDDCPCADLGFFWIDVRSCEDFIALTFFSSSDPPVRIRGESRVDKVASTSAAKAAWAVEMGTLWRKPRGQKSLVRVASDSCDSSKEEASSVTPVA